MSDYLEPSRSKEQDSSLPEAIDIGQRFANVARLEFKHIASLN